MAIFHLAITHASRRNGLSAKAHADYIAREGRYGRGSYREDFVHAEHLGMPAWASETPLAFWEAADTYERANGRLYTEIQVALPRELEQEMQLALVRDFVREQIGEDHPTTWALHNRPAQDGGMNPHAHIMLSERTLDGIERDANCFFKRANAKQPERGGAAKDPEWNKRDKVDQLRQAWEHSANLALQRAGLDLTIDRRSLEAQGIDRAPEPKLGPAQTAMMRRGEFTEAAEQVRELRELRGELTRLEHELTDLQTQLSEPERDEPAPAQSVTEPEPVEPVQESPEDIELMDHPTPAEEPDPPTRSDDPLDAILERVELRRQEWERELGLAPGTLPRETGEQVLERLLAQREARLQAEREHSSTRDLTPSPPPQTETPTLTPPAPREPNLPTDFSTLASVRNAELNWQISLVQDKAERALGTAKTQLYWQQKRLQTHEQAKPEPPRGLLAVFRKRQFDAMAKEWETTRKQLQRRERKLRQRVKTIAQYVSPDRQADPPRRRQLAAQWLRRARPELAEQFEQAQAQEHLKRGERWSPPEREPDPALPTDFPTLASLWKADCDRHFTPIQEQAQRLKAQAEAQLQRQGERYHQHEAAPPEAKVSDWFRTGGYPQRLDTWKQQQQQMRRRWLKLRERVQRLDDYTRKGFLESYPSHGERLAEKRLRAERPELARHYDRVREQERAKEAAERQRQREQAWQQQRERDRGKGMER